MMAHMSIARTVLAIPLIFAAFAGVTDRAAAEQALFESRRLTPPPSDYPSGIEGPAVDAAGILYVVNFKNKGTIGQLKPGAARSELFAKLPPGSIGNGIRFDREGRMYVADFKTHKVLVFEPGQKEATVYFQSDKFNQPNDLAIAADGTLYASDPNFGKKTGQIWRITRGSDGKASGEVMMSSERPKMGITNGLDLSPDGKTLYVSESNTREVWSYGLDGAKLTGAKRLTKFDGPPGSELDGMRTDAGGNIFVTRPNNGTVAMVAPDGNLVREIRLLGKAPTNLTFGGPDGKTVFVTQSAGGFIEAFRVERPGREPCMQFGGAFC